MLSPLCGSEYSDKRVFLFCSPVVLVEEVRTLSCHELLNGCIGTPSKGLPA